MSFRIAGSAAASALADSRTLLSVTLQTPSAEQTFTLSCLACVSKAVRRASMPVWRELCVARWPSSDTVHVNEPSAWRAFALARSAAESEETPSVMKLMQFGAAIWKQDDLKPFLRHSKPVILLDVFLDDSAIFSAWLGNGDDLRSFPFEDYGVQDDGLAADDDDQAEEFADAHLQLHATADKLPSFSERLVFVRVQGGNCLDSDVCLIQDDQDLELWFEEAQAPSITAQLCLMLTPHKIAVMHLGAPTCLSDVTDQGRDLDASGTLRWARTIVAGESGRSSPGLDVIINLCCVNCEDDTDAGVAEADLADSDSESSESDADEPHERAAPTSMRITSSGSESSESDATAGEEAVRDAAEARLNRLRQALRDNKAEQAVIVRQIKECMNVCTGGEGGHDSDFAAESDSDLVATPHHSNSSQHSLTTASGTSSDSAGGIAPSKCMRLELASLSLGWLPCNAGEEHLRSRRDEWAREHDFLLHEVSDDFEDSCFEDDEGAHEAEAAEFWGQIEALVPWLSVEQNLLGRGQNRRGTF